MIHMRFRLLASAFIFCSILALSQLTAADESIQVQVVGKLNSEIFAIGGETTGVVITANGVSWELDLGDNAELRKTASTENGKTVMATGEFKTKKGVEIAQRSIVTVDSLKAVDAKKESINVTITGSLNSEVVAIGGETTGVVISASGATWELDLGDNAELRKTAAELHEKSATADGEFEMKKGVEIGKRSIVKVASLEPASDAKDGANPYLTAEGKLKHALTLKDAQGGFAGFSGHIWTIEPDGAWRRQPFLNQTVRDADQTGKFEPAVIKYLAEHLAEQNLLGLPKQIGKNIGANPHNFTLTFGDHESTMILPPGAEPPAKDPRNADSAEQRFAALVRLLKRGMKGEAPEK